MQAQAECPECREEWTRDIGSGRTHMRQCIYCDANDVFIKYVVSSSSYLFYDLDEFDASDVFIKYVVSSSSYEPNWDLVTLFMTLMNYCHVYKVNVYKARLN